MTLKARTHAPQALCPLVIATTLFISGCPQPSCRGEVACDGITDPLRTCLNFCAPRWDFESTVVQHCVADACDEAIWDDPALVGTLRSCPGTSRCVPDLRRPEDPDTGLGTCQRADTLLTTCEAPDDEHPLRLDTCGDGSFCLNVDGGAAAAPRYFEALSRGSGPPILAGNVCFWPVTEGQPCDSSLADRDTIIDGRRVRMGADPCEEGTYCLDDPTTPGTERRCLRPCTGATGAADANLCDCEDALCRNTGFLTSPETGERLGTFFCRPCLRSNRGGCGEDLDVPCCDGSASCHPDVFFPEPGNTVCCRPTGADCDPDAATPQCCEDSVCTAAGSASARCQPCSIDGEPPGNFGCCPNHVIVGAGTGSPVCRYCTRVETVVDTRGGVEARGYCASERFEIRTSDQARADGIFVASSEVEYPYFFGGLLAGNLSSTVGDSSIALMDLGPEYRAYLFEQDVRAGTSVDGLYVELPRDDLETGGAIATPTNFPTATSFMLTDLGACSSRTSWDTFAAVISAGVTRQLALRAFPRDGSAALLSDVRTRTGMTLSPVVRAQPTSVYGLARDESYVDVVTQYEANLLPGGPFCDGVRQIQLTARLIPDLVPGFIVDANTRTDDAAAVTVRCLAPAVTDMVYTCTMPDVVGGVFTTRTMTFPRRGNYYFEDRSDPPTALQDIRFRDVQFAPLSCRPVRDEIVCTNVPRVTDDVSCYPGADNCPCTSCTVECGVTPFGGTVNCFEGTTAEDDAYVPQLIFERERAYPRRVTFVPGARDIELTVAAVEVDIDDPCDLEELITSSLESIITRVVRGEISDQITRAVQLILGSRATSDFDVPASLLRTCTVDSDCAAGLVGGTLLFGGSRHGCVDHDSNAATPQLCDLVRFEPRRLYVGPRGLDLVLADGLDDPQAAAFTGGVFTPLGDDDLVSCAPDRLTAMPPLSTSPVPPRLVLPEGRSTRRLAETSRRLCDGSEADPSACICAQTGTICGFGANVTAAGYGVPGMDVAPSGMVCTNPTAPNVACCLPGTTTCTVELVP